jgi:putative ABC transport system permease protein
LSSPLREESLIRILRVALRNFARHPAFTLINVGGLSVGMACCLMIALYVRNEKSYDGYHVNAERIFRVGAQLSFGNRTELTARTPLPLAAALKDKIPEIESVVRFGRDDPVVRKNEVLFREERFYYADASVFSVFSFLIKEGDPETALVEPFSIVLTEDAARKYFGDRDPVGDVLTVGGSAMTVTAVMGNVPPNSHFVFDFLASYATLKVKNPDQWEAWDNYVTSTYVLLRKDASKQAVESKISGMGASLFSPSDGLGRLLLHPLRDLHFRSRLPGELGPGGNETALFVFSGVALFILLIACINFVNLLVARASTRVREVGVRKVLGALRRDLVGQFLLESTLLVMIALLFAIAAVKMLLPEMNVLFEKQIAAPGAELVVSLLAIGLVVGLATGLYPALFLSAFTPVKMFRNLADGGGKPRFQSLLVTVQFAISAAFIASSLIVARQLNFVQSKDLGFDKENVVIISLRDSPALKNISVLKTAVLRSPNVVSASATYHTPARGLAEYEAVIEGQLQPQVVTTYIVDEDFVQTYEIALVKGRGFSRDFPSDISSAFLVNESAVRKFGWAEPIGKEIVWDSHKRGRVIGVVRDFHIRSLHDAIEPMLIHVDPEYFHYLSVRVRANQMGPFLNFLKDTWRRMAPDSPLRYSFLDEDFGEQYRSDERMAKIMDASSGLGILLACLGLVALASLAVSRRFKEMGIRKVLGANAGNIAGLLVVEFLKLVAVANVVAVPAVLFVMNRWLENFAYHVPIEPNVFILTIIATLLASLLCIAVFVLRAAMVNPVETLKYE